MENKLHGVWGDMKYWCMRSHWTPVFGMCTIQLYGKTFAAAKQWLVLNITHTGRVKRGK